MADKKIKAIIFGVGATGKQSIRCMTDHGVDVVGAVDIRNIGKDIGELSGIAPLGVVLEKDAEAVIKRTKPDIAILNSASEMEQTYPIMKLCVENKLDVITIAEEAYYPWYTAPAMAKELDTLAKENGVTIYGTGIQDVFWSNLSVVLSGGCNKIASIRGENYCLMDDFGPIVADEAYVGKTLDEFNKLTSGSDAANPLVKAFTIALYAIAAELELHVVEEIQSCKPLLAKTDVYADKLNRSIPKGWVIGITATAELKTEEGISLFGTIIGKITEEGDQASNKWLIEGEPTINLITEDMHGEVTTSIDAVNRIPDVINAEPGLKTVVDMPKPRFRALPFPHYIKNSIRDRRYRYI